MCVWWGGAGGGEYQNLNFGLCAKGQNYFLKNALSVEQK